MQDTKVLTIETPAVKKPKKKYNLEEKKITTAITNWLKKLDECWYFKKAGGTGRLPSGMFLKQRSGVPDLCVCYRGRTVWFEIKKPGNNLQDDQKIEIAKMIGAGAEVFVVRDLQTVKDILLGV